MKNKNTYSKFITLASLAKVAAKGKEKQRRTSYFAILVIYEKKKRV